VSIGTSSLFTVDVSAGGFQAETMHSLVPGAEVSGVLDLAGQRYAFAGVVAWVKVGSPRMGLRNKVGVRFTSVDQGFYEQLGARPAR
jgi:hypothetical protein